MKPSNGSLKKDFEKLDSIKSITLSEFNNKTNSIPHKNGTLNFMIDYLNLLADTIKILNNRFVKGVNEMLELKKIEKTQNTEVYKQSLIKYCQKLIRDFIDVVKPR